MAKEKKNKKVLWILLGIIAFLCLSVILFMKSPLFDVELATRETHLEIGSALEKDPAYYLDGEDWCVSLSLVDTSSVKQTKVGRYPIYIYHGFNKYTCYVNVTDTLAPVIACDIKNKTITPGETLSVHSLGLKIEDHSEIESIAFTKIASSRFYTGLPDEETVEMREAYLKGLDMFAEEFQFAYGGIYTLTISVTDEFQNSSEITLTLTVEQPPVIEAPTDIYIATDCEADFTDYITAWDFIDESFDAEDVKVDTTGLNLNTPGEYTIYFTAADSYGLSTTAATTIHVSPQNDLQELINTHVININDHIIIGAYNAYDSGYYTGESIAYIQQIMLPAIVYIENDKLEAFGSGFIIEINEDFVTIATNEHIINGDLIVDVTFFDSSVYNGSVVASDAREDIAFIRIPIDEKESDSSLPADYVNTLRTVHINKEYWNSLANDCGITICYICIDINGEIWISNEGTIVEKTAVRDWNNYKEINETIISMDPVSGSSGSALFDEEGRLVGMVRGYTDYVTYSETVAVPLDEILEYFEKVFKYKIEYQ